MVDGPIEFSPEALEAFRAKVRKAPGVRAVRLGIKGGACSGMQYIIEFDYGPVHMGDTEWDPKGWDEFGYDPNLAEGSRVYKVWFRVDKKSLLYLNGTKVTWHKSLMKEGFDFENPHEASRCGCGHSFSVK